MKPASPIHLLERDYFLQFHRRLDVWPPEKLDILDVAVAEEEEAPGTWMAGAWKPRMLDTQRGGYLWRELKREPRASDPHHRRKTILRESMLRFPSAPLFGSQSKTGYQVQMTSFHQHTLRLLKSAQRIDEPVTKIFLLFNGLNELDHLGFYYDLAGLLINDTRDAANVACLIVPFPAHLTRYPLIGRYAEKPLQRFISDPSDLFRQYLRFMVETQWLISTVVPISDYPVTSGIPLLEPHAELDRSRCNPEILGAAIYKAWQTIFSYSKRRGAEISSDDVIQSITVLRDVIGWNASSAKVTERSSAPLGHPQLHVIGYSLGGYLAQSVFFSWPYAIGSCTTLCSGGALTGLRTEKIIHEEEWRAITHGLQYDIESGMLEGRITGDDPQNPQNPTSICGIPASAFTSHFQTFTDIFLQDPYGTYRHRVSEFAPRLFFVVGGNDPIVPTRSVLDTSPPDGINMIEIAKLSHFIATERGEWPDFWLPTITNIVSSLSDHSEHLLWTSTLNNLWNDKPFYAAERDLLNSKNIREHTAKFQRHANAVRRDPQPLNSEEIQQTILRFVKLLENKEGGEREERGRGFLFVLRNQIPVTLMGRKVLHRRGAVPHYDDLEILRYWLHLQEQRVGMRDAADRVTIVIPAHLNGWFVERMPTLSFKHLPIVQEFPDHQSRQAEIWEEFLEDWEATGALYRFDAQADKGLGEGFQLEKLIREDTATPIDFWIMNCLPDTWISLSAAAVRDLAGGDADREVILNALRKRMLRIYTAHRKKGKEALTNDEEQAVADLQRLLDKDDLQILRISAAQSSPRYLGELVRDRSVAIDVLMHTALALARSTQCREKNDFARGGKAARPSDIETIKQFDNLLGEEIGHGAMADVYESVKEGRVIAIKRMSQEALQDPNNRKRFAHEAKVSISLNHPNIVRVYDHGEIDGVPVLLMERLYGEPLKASIDAHKRFAPRDAARLAIQLADALDYMHLRNVYHRDLKPGNIMLVDDGNTAKIMDFGIAVTPDTERLTETGMVIGTPRYMLPDSLAGYEALQRGDLYALGLILYEMLTGQYAAELRARIWKDHPLPSAVVSDLPISLDTIVAKLLAREPSVGYESARKLLDDLKTFVGPEG